MDASRLENLTEWVSSSHGPFGLLAGACLSVDLVGLWVGSSVTLFFFAVVSTLFVGLSFLAPVLRYGCGVVWLLSVGGLPLPPS